MLTPIVNSAGPGVGADAIFTHDISLDPLEALHAARQFHELLIEDVNMRGCERRVLARQISGRLFAAEADHILPDPARAFFVRLRTDAFQRAAAMNSNKMASLERIRAGYNQIEEGLRNSA